MSKPQPHSGTWWKDKLEKFSDSSELEPAIFLNHLLYCVQRETERKNINLFKALTFCGHVMLIMYIYIYMYMYYVQLFCFWTLPIIMFLFKIHNVSPGLEIPEYGLRDPLRWPCGTLYPHKLALTSPTRGGRWVGRVLLRTKATELVIHNVSETRFRLCVKVAITQLGPINRANPYIRTE
jgi:hypothetical protein